MKPVTTKKDYDLIQYGIDVGYFYIEEGTGQLYVSLTSKMNYEQLISGYKMEMEKEKKRLSEMKKKGI